MKAQYQTVEGDVGEFNYPVVVPQEAEGGGFTLVGFEGYEELSEGKMCAAITGLRQFALKNDKVGF